MLYLIGIGLKPEHLTLEAREAMGKCSRVFLDTYTSSYSQGSVEGLKELLGKEIVELDRRGVEGGFSLLLKEAKKTGESIALLVFGNPLSATTHIQLLLDARRIGVEARVVPGISIYNLLGETGLDPYRFGRTCTIVSPSPNYAPESFFDAIEKNFKAGMHSLCLLDTGTGSSGMMSVSGAVGLLQKIEKRRGGSLLQEATLVGLYGMGSGEQKVKAGSLRELQRSSYAAFPQSLVVAAPLNEKEEEAVGVLQGAGRD